MIFSKIKEYFLQKALKHSSKEDRGVMLAKTIKRVGILTLKELNDEYDFKEKVKRVFPEYRSVNCYSYRDFNKTDEKSFTCFSEKDFDWRGEIKDNSLQSFVNESFDVLICYFDSNHVFLESLVQQSKAHFKIGFSNINQSLFDLEISESIKNVDSFNLELKKYLQILGNQQA